MDVKVHKGGKAFQAIHARRDLVKQFIDKAEKVEIETLKVDRDLFVEAANQKNISFEFIKLESFQLNRESIQINNAKNAIVEAEYGIAETGSIVFDTSDQEFLLTICMAETLHVVLPASNVLESTLDLELIKGNSEDLNDRMKVINGLVRKNDDKHFNNKNMRTLVYLIEDL